MKHLLKLLDLTTEEIEEILNLADQLKYELKHGIEHHHLKDVYKRQMRQHADLLMPQTVQITW